MGHVSVKQSVAEFAPHQQAMLRKAIADRRIENVREVQNEDVMFLRGDIGDVIGMALEVKPVVWLSSEFVEQNLVTRELQDQGIDGFALRNGSLVNRTLLERRLTQQFELAVELGWDERLTLEGNLSLLTAQGPESLNMTELTNFDLGIP